MLEAFVPFVVYFNKNKTVGRQTLTQPSLKTIRQSQYPPVPLRKTLPSLAAYVAARENQ